VTMRERVAMEIYGWGILFSSADLHADWMSETKTTRKHFRVKADKILAIVRKVEGRAQGGKA
jgi:hypothetical protein